MRVLMLFVIGFVIGCAAGIWMFNGLWLLAVAAVLIAAWLCLRFLKQSSRFLKITAILIFGAALGLCWIFIYDSMYIQPVRQLNGTNRNATVEITDYSTENSRGSCGKGKITFEDKSYKVYYYLSEDIKLRPGDKVKGSFSFSFTGFGEENEPTYHQGSGIFLIVSAKDPVKIIRCKETPAKYFPAYFRRQITNKINEVFPDDVSGFAKALLLGDTSDLRSADDAALKVSGIRHVVAVSGLHISILMSFVYFLVRDRRFLNSFLGIPLLLLFTAIAGFTPSVVRACVMQIVFIIGMEIEKEYDAPTALALAVLLLIVINPLVITSISFQLSVACVIGILLFSEKIYHFLLRTKLGPAKGKTLKSRIIRTAVQSVSITLSTMAATVPISAYYFGSVSLVSILSNLLLLWLISICFYGVAISCLLGFIAPFLGSWLAYGVSWIVRFILFAARCLSKIPFACVSSNNLYVLLWMIFVYCLFALFLLCKHRKPFLFCGLAVAGLFVSLLLACAEVRLDRYRVTVLDVGQGQCIVIQSKNDCYIVDCGGFSDYASADLAAQTLRTCGYSKIDGLILTHFDYDHAGSAEALLCQIDAEKIYVPDADAENNIRKALEYEYSGSLCKVRKTMNLDCGVGDITIIPGEPGKDGNESSLCILFQADNCDILITGDRNTKGERYLIDHSQLPLIDILVVGHHGADSSTSLYLLQKLQPLTAVISVGEDNHYGHPDPVIMKRLERFNCTILRTDQDGTIVFRG